MKSLTKKISFSLIIVAAIVLGACHKEGVGGKGTLKGTVEHHGSAIPNAVVYIKYGAVEFPGSDVSAYDDEVVADGSGNYEFKELYRGDYYLFGTGYDNSIGDAVSGGVTYKLRRNESATVDIPVTE